jgi:hypothetical protein
MVIHLRGLERPVRACGPPSEADVKILAAAAWGAGIRER